MTPELEFILSAAAAVLALLLAYVAFTRTTWAA